MPYFVAVLASDGARWTSHPLDVDALAELEDPEALADAVRDTADVPGPALLLLEREDEWFAVVRVDGEDDPRIFVSDAMGAASTPYAASLGLDALADEAPPAAPGGDDDLLDDLGTPPERLVALSSDDAPTPADALSEIARAAGFEDALDALR